MIRLLAIAAALLPWGCAHDSDYPNGYPNRPQYADERFNFAQFYYGLDLQLLPEGKTTYLDEAGAEHDGTIATRAVPRATIGAFHYWGHVDFFVAFSLMELGAGEKDGLKTELERGGGIGFGIRYFPWAIAPDTVRPFVGVHALANINYKQESDGEPNDAEYARDIAPLAAGVGYASPIGFLEAGADWLYRPDFDYWVSRDKAVHVELPRTSYWVGYKSVADLTSWRRNPPSPVGDSWEVAVGPTTAMPSVGSSYVNERHPYFGRRPFGSNLELELAGGYHFEDLATHVGVAYRNFGAELEGFDQKLTYEREAYTLEAYRFFFDHYGFVPYAGPNVGRERQRFREQSGGDEVTDVERWVWVPGVTFGWDIRPMKVQKLLLRTNLRYMFQKPMEVGPSGEEGTVSFEQLEFNWIELVWYPNR